MDGTLENMHDELLRIGERARRAALALGGVRPEDKTRALELMADRLDAAREATENYRRFMELVRRYVEACEKRFKL